METQAISSMFSEPVYLVGDDAYPRAVRESLSNAIIFHFAGHSFAGSSGTIFVLPSGRGDSLAGEFVSIHDLLPKDVGHLQLVVLSACSTGSMLPGNLKAIAQPFFLEGVPQIIASRWAVDSSSTTRTMIGFYKYLLTGDTAESSLRKTSIELLGRSYTAHPYYWASFRVEGKF